MTSGAGSQTRDWDGEVYDRVADNQEEWGLEVLARLDLRGDEVVLDAGCGTGRVTRHVIDRVPEGRVLGVDGSPSMVVKAREKMGDRADFEVADLARLKVDAPFDVVFSTAVFHWIPDHPGLFERLRAALRPGGRLAAQCGGAGNVARLAVAAEEVAGRDAFARYFAGWEGRWNFATAEETADRLRQCGFTEVRTWLEAKQVTPVEPLAYLAQVTLGPRLDALPEDLKQSFTEAVAAEMPEPLTLDYVRLNIDAVAA